MMCCEFSDKLNVGGGVQHFSEAALVLPLLINIHLPAISLFCKNTLSTRLANFSLGLSISKFFWF